MSFKYINIDPEFNYFNKDEQQMKLKIDLNKELLHKTDRIKQMMINFNKIDYAQNFILNNNYCYYGKIKHYKSSDYWCIDVHKIINYYICDYCSKKYKYSGSLINHEKKKHNIIYISDDEIDEKKIDDIKQWKNKKEMHKELINKSEYKYRCEFCHRRYKCYKVLHYHEIIDHVDTDTEIDWVPDDSEQNDWILNSDEE